MQQGGRLVGQHLLGVVDLGAFKPLQPRDLIHRQVGEQLQELDDVGVLGVAPHLPVVIRAQSVGVQPDRAADALAHLLARGGGKQRCGQAKGLLALHAPDQLDAVDDVAPLIGAAHLQGTAQPAVQLDEVGRLHRHVVELEEAHRLLAFQPQFDAVESQHPVDREVHAVVAQELDIAEPLQPLGIVQHHRLRRPVAELQELGEGLLDAGDIGRDHGVRQQGPLLVLVGGVADLGCAAAHQRDGLVTAFLQPAQHHDRDQMADMQAVGGGVVTDVGRDHAGVQRRIQRLQVGALMQVAALDHDPQEVGPGLERRDVGIGWHGRFPCSGFRPETVSWQEPDADHLAAGRDEPAAR